MMQFVKLGLTLLGVSCFNVTSAARGFLFLCLILQQEPGSESIHMEGVSVSTSECFNYKYTFLLG